MEGFHYKDGLFFKRNKDNSVTITQLKENNINCTESIFEVMIDENGWASIVSSVSNKGEEDNRFWRALQFHNE